MFKVRNQQNSRVPNGDPLWRLGGRAIAGLATYKVGGVSPSLVLDFESNIYALDDTGSFNIYEVDGVSPSLVLDFEKDSYGTNTGAWQDQYVVGEIKPSLVLDFEENNYGRV